MPKAGSTEKPLELFTWRSLLEGPAELKLRPLRTGCQPAGAACPRGCDSWIRERGENCALEPTAATGTNCCCQGEEASLG